MKYAIRSKRGNYLRNNGQGFQLGSVVTFGEWALFDSVPDALRALEDRAARYGQTDRGVAILRVEEIPGETKREVVELEGVVDFAGLKFALRDTPRGLRLYPYFYISSDLMEWSRDVEGASLFDSPEALWQDVKDSGRVCIQPSSHRVVGIREVTTAPTFKITELA